jgi:hypothetical protein
VSTILKALRRLEEEREAEPRDLRDQVVARPTAPEARPRLPLLIGAGAVGAALVIGGFLYLERGDGTPAPPAAARSVPPPPAPTGGVARAIPETRIDVPPPPREAPRPARVASTLPPAPRPTPGVAAPPPAPAAVPEPAPAPVVASVSAPPKPTPEPVRASPAPEPASAPAAPPDPMPSTAEAPPVEPASPPPPAIEPEPAPPPGIVGEPAVARRRPLPRIVVERTLWHPYNERRVAYLTVEGHEGTVELREGDAVGEAVVKQIDPSAVLFVHRGVEIRRRVGAAN